MLGLNATRALRRFWLVACFWGLCIWLSGPSVQADPLPDAEIHYFRLGTGTSAGTYFTVGGLIASALSSPPGAQPCGHGGSCGVPGLIALAQASSGGFENLDLLRSGALEAALIQANFAALAQEGQARYAGRAFSDLRAVAALYLETVQIVVPAASPIRTVADLRGRKLSVGEQDSAIAADSRLVLNGLGVAETQYYPVFLRPGPAVDQLVDGKIDALFVLGGAPFAAVDDAARRLDIRLIPIPPASASALLAGQPFFTTTVLPAETYPGVTETPTIGVPALLTVRTDLDEALVYGITQTLWHPSTRKALVQGLPRARFLPMAASVAQTALPLHPGAARFYHEAENAGP